MFEISASYAKQIIPEKRKRIKETSSLFKRFRERGGGERREEAREQGYHSDDVKGDAMHTI